MAAQRPCPLCGVESDNGRALINDHLLGGRQARPAGPPVQFTRSRPSQKDEKAHGEPKTWTQVRKLVGGERADTPEGLAALKTLSADLRLVQNPGLPSMPLVRKVRVGSRLVRRYAAPQPPFERGQACPRPIGPRGPACNACGRPRPRSNSPGGAIGR